MYVEQGEMFDGLIAAGFTPTQVSALRGIFTQCMLKHVSRGQLSLHGSRPDGATDAVLSLANFPPTGEITDSAVPDSEGEMRNGWALDVVFGAVRFGGAVVFDGPVFNNGGFAAMPIGSVIQWAGAIADIPSGWALMDGTSNASPGSGIDMRGMVPYGYSGAGDFATIGGTIAVALATTFSGSGTVSLVGNNLSNHYHKMVKSTVVSAIADHPSHTHTVPHSGTEGTGTPGTVDTAYGGGSFTTSGPSVTLSHSASSGDTYVLTGTEVDADGDPFTLTPTGTSSISTIASGLSVGTPSTVRPAGKVLAYIEKVA